MEPYRYTDYAGDMLAVRPHPGRPATAMVDCDPDGSDMAVAVPAHKLAEVVTAMYQAAGQPPPDLPVIQDQAEVKRLAALLWFACDGTMGPGGTAEFNIARVLLAHGVTLPEATP